LKERINRLFWFDSKSTNQNSFQTFSKTPKYKTIGCFDKTTGCFDKTTGCFDKTTGCFDKTTGCFSLSLKNTLNLKDLKTLKL